jgi:hypothetical protein
VNVLTDQSASPPHGLKLGCSVCNAAAAAGSVISAATEFIWRARCKMRICHATTFLPVGKSLSEREMEYTIRGSLHFSAQRRSLAAVTLRFHVCVLLAAVPPISSVALCVLTMEYKIK